MHSPTTLALRPQQQQRSPATHCQDCGSHGEGQEGKLAVDVNLQERNLHLLFPVQFVFVGDKRPPQEGCTHWIAGVREREREKMLRKKSYETKMYMHERKVKIVCECEKSKNYVSM